MGAAGQAGTSPPCVPSQSTDCCPDDPNKSEPGACGCGIADEDGDSDGEANCVDSAPYGWTRQLTLDGTQIGGALSNFPVLVRIDDSHLQSNAAADGGDIYFATADGTTPLAFEIESYAPATGSLVAWVHVPSLTAGTDAVITLGYDDGKTGRSNAASVWTAYHYVWHLAQDPSAGASAIKDSTGRAHGTAQGGMAAGARAAAVAGNGLSFDGSNDEVTFTSDLAGSGPTTMSGWVRQAADSGDNGSSIISVGTGAVNRSRFLLSRAEQNRIKIGFYGNDEFATTVLPFDTWKHVAWVWTGSQTTVFVDGAAVLGPVSHTSANTQGTTGSIGGTTFGYDFFMTGMLDEVHVTTDARPAAWIATEFNNQRPGSTFIEAIGAATAAASH